MRLGGQEGQATLELALCLPVLAIVCAAVVEIALVGVDQVRVWHAAREAARISAVEPDPAAATDAARASGLDGLEVSVEPGAEERAPGRPTTVHVAYPYDARVPVVGAVFERLVLAADATTRIERS
ncbi:MAG TPA: TadE family protein [Actinomycetota bacterium]|nr:TadE family protein [Actinomycetota bacterium]